MAVPSNNRIHAEINDNFFMRVQTFGIPGNEIVSANSLVKKIGEELAQKYFIKVLNYEKNKYIFKLRERYITTFQIK